jgi:hypothetical protein
MLNTVFAVFMCINSQCTIGEGPIVHSLAECEQVKQEIIRKQTPGSQSAPLRCFSRKVDTWEPAE